MQSSEKDKEAYNPCQTRLGRRDMTEDDFQGCTNPKVKEERDL